eukprot:CAMPEP_0174348610 /NCGR_PEP_ID=MMETSP0811_2-20130205/5147_1 /TAXON_ID=73025 ORGANISM="Eutreptiella gymnastica-like, Strain CCMP1594" /NCGR_SAMPLE_ID=MMETSP0811_2 /ASSEMBLY_ACC=CAM_ASM_000667 /LENGTH=54 /DNA_ID=CAMNT_0015475321 /DNA_START=212 /DNA_END=376 /DNA_ORIENTATION=-
MIVSGRKFPLPCIPPERPAAGSEDREDTTMLQTGVCPQPSHASVPHTSMGSYSL